MNTEDAVAATNPYPRRTVDDLPLEAADQVLLEEIMSTPTATATHTPRPTRPGRRRPWLATVAAAAAVATVVAGGVALKGGQPTSGPGPSPYSSGNSVPAVDPGLPPTAGNLLQVQLLRDGWSIRYLNDAPWGGSIRWEKGGYTLEMDWYEAEDYGRRLADLRAGDDPESSVRLLGQDGLTSDIGTISGPPIRIDPPNEGFTWTAEGEPQYPDGTHRLRTILPPVGDRFMEFDGFVSDVDEYANLMASLTRVERGAWLAAIDSDDVVVPAEGEAFLQEAGQDVPMPEGVSVTVGDLWLPQDAYQARVAFMVPVLCGWAEEYAAGNDAALAVLRGSASWPVMQATASEGGFADAIAEGVRYLAGEDPTGTGGARVGVAETPSFRTCPVERQDGRMTERLERSRAHSGSPYETHVGFSRGARAGNVIAISGTAPVWPDGHVDADPAAQARRCWEIALTALTDLGGRLDEVIRTRMYVVSADDADAVGSVHGEVFGQIRPASTMVVVAGLLDPRWLVEVELDAVLG